MGKCASELSDAERETRKTYGRSYYLANKDKWKRSSEKRKNDAEIRKRYLARKAAYRKGHKEQIAAGRKRHYEENRERILEANRAQRDPDYYKKNREKLLGEARQRYYKDVDKSREKALRYYYENHARKLEIKKEVRKRCRPQIAAYKKDYARRKPEIIKAIQRRKYERHKEQYAYHSTKRRLRELAAAVDSRAAIEAHLRTIYYGDKVICHLCGKPIPQAQRVADHVIPLSRGGPHSVSNLKPAHRHCNAVKGKKLDHECANEFGRLF